MCAANPAIFIELQFGFWHIEFKSASAESSASQDKCESFHAFKHCANIFRNFGRFGSLIKECHYLFVMKPFFNFDNATLKSNRGLAPLGIKINHHGLNIPDFILLKACKVIGNGFRKHGYNFAGQINTCGSAACFAIECPALFDKMCHISDMNPKSPMARSWIKFNLHCIIKIFCIDGVDGDYGVFGVIYPAIKIFLGKIFCDMVGFIKYIRRENVR